MPNRLVNKAIKIYLIINSKLHKPSFKMQESIIFGLLDKCKDTVFGRKYGFKDINTIEEFQDAVPISHYKDFERWITYMLKGEKDITYPGKIDRFATSS
ncbi:GH3 auxin-responsive promoter family protein [Patescibacteria group bacterium]|nr:GH3 auxin-responsive promoter family protein [Patescibacteria group bacterium]MBU1758260.1 GH3 auxin-responsive promoter family protein [Patescibacteria group bacterium]